MFSSENTFAHATMLDVDASLFQKYTFKDRHPTPPHLYRLQDIRPKFHFFQAID